jgi:hypothetical protein
MFGGSQKHPNFEQVAKSVQNNLGLQLSPPGEDVLAVIDTMTTRELLDIQNTLAIEAARDLFMRQSLRATVDSAARTLLLSVAPREEIETELKTAQTAVKVLHIPSHQGTSKIIRSFGPAAPEPSKITAPTASGQLTPSDTESIPVPTGFENLEAVERLCPVVVDLFVKHGQLTSADKDVIKKIRPIDYTLEARIVALERWKTEISRRSRGIHVREAGPSTLLGGGGDDASSTNTDGTVRRRLDTFLHWLSKLIKAYEGRGIKFHGKPVWLQR